MIFDHDLEAFESHARDQILVVTGAGISLASGIPTSAAST
jgi:NAD-dependent SIR2 family protein deacetylase